MGQSFLLVMQAAVKCSLTASVAAVDPRLGLVFLPAEGHGGKLDVESRLKRAAGWRKYVLKTKDFGGVRLGRNVLD